MNRILLFLLAISATSCHQSIIAEAQDVQKNALNYFLEFDITPIDYTSSDEQETVPVFSNQDVDITVDFQDLATTDRYFYFTGYGPVPEDSIALIGQVHFDLSDDTPFEQEEFMLEFVLLEARSHLTLQPDGSYKYDNLEILADQLQNSNWSNSMFSGAAPMSEFLLSFPDAQLSEHQMENYIMTSNGFYFEHENLEFTGIEYNANNNTINLSGNFTVEMKILSCGFYSYFLVENAHFQALIH